MFWMLEKLKEYDVVRVISPTCAGSAVNIDDIGSAIMILEGLDEEAYEVECVLPDGTTKWLQTFKRSQLRYEPDLNKDITEQDGCT